MKEMALNGAKLRFIVIWLTLLQQLLKNTKYLHLAMASKCTMLFGTRRKRGWFLTTRFLICIATYLNTFIRTINTFPSLRIFAVNLMNVEIFREILFSRRRSLFAPGYAGPVWYLIYSLYTKVYIEGQGMSRFSTDHPRSTVHDLNSLVSGDPILNRGQGLPQRAGVHGNPRWQSTV